MAGSPLPQVAVVACTVRDGRLAALQPSGATRGVTAQVPLGATQAPDAAATALTQRLFGRAAVWRSQVGALRTDAGLVLLYVAALGADIEAPAGYAWQPLPRATGAAGSAATSLLRAAVGQLRDRLDREPVAFRLLGPTFTLSDLQQVYELLLERRLHKASFRRALLAAHLVEPTDAWRSEGRGRPAQLFRYAPRRGRGLPRAVRFDLLG